MGSAVATFAPDPGDFVPPAYKSFLARERVLDAAVPGDVREALRRKFGRSGLRLYRQMTGRRAVIPEEVAEFCDRLDEYEARSHANSTTTDDVVSFSYQPSTLTTCSRKDDDMPDNEWDELLAKRRGSTQAVATKPEPLSASQEAARPYLRDLHGPTLGPRPIPEPHPTAGLTLTSLERARAVLGDRLAEVAKAEIGRVPRTQPIVTNAFREGVFVRAIAEEYARAVAVFALLGEGSDLDEVEVDRRVGKIIVQMWFSFSSSKPGVTGATVLRDLLSKGRDMLSGCDHRLAEIESDLLALDASIEQVGLAKYCPRVEKLLVDRETTKSRLTLMTESLAGIRKVLVSEVGRAVGLIEGGAAALAVCVREARQSLGDFLPPDTALADLQGKLDAAAADMDRFRTVDPDAPEGLMYKAARDRRDALLLPVHERRVEVERSASAAINEEIGRAVGGDIEAYGTLVDLVARVPLAFPEPFRVALGNAAREAVGEAGGFMYAT